MHARSTSKFEAFEADDRRECFGRRGLAWNLERAERLPHTPATRAGTVGCKVFALPALGGAGNKCATVPRANLAAVEKKRNQGAHQAHCAPPRRRPRRHARPAPSVSGANDMGLAADRSW